MSEFNAFAFQVLKIFDTHEGQHPGRYLSMAGLATEIDNQDSAMMDEGPLRPTVHALVERDWLETDGDGFDLWDNSFRITAKGQLKIASSTDYVDQLTQAIGSLPIAPDVAENEVPSDPPLRVRSGSWTGLVLREEQVDAAIKEIDKLRVTVEALGLDNVKRCQALALLSAARALLDAPEPPLNIVRDIIQHFDRIIGIAGFLIGWISLVQSWNT